MTPPLYHYRLELVRVIDGDTIVINIDLGLNMWAQNQIVRLYGVDTPELHGDQKPLGLLAKAFTETWLAGRDDLWLWSRKYDEREKYGRILGTVMRGDDPISLSDALIAAGHVKQ